MADIPIATAAVESVTTAPAPIQAAPAVAVQTPQPTPAPSAPNPGMAQPTAAPAPSAAPAEAGQPQTNPQQPTILSDALKAPADSNPTAPEAGQPQPDQAQTDSDVAQSDDPAPLPVYEPFTFPEGVTVDDAKIGEFTNILGEFEAKTRADHGEMQALAQRMVDFHASEMQALAERIEAEKVEYWHKTTNGWVDQVRSDPEIGGNRFNTSVNNAAKFVRTYGGTEDQQAEFKELMNMTGAGNHPAMIRLLANASARLAEGSPLVAKAPPEHSKPIHERFYNNKG